MQVIEDKFRYNLKGNCNKMLCIAFYDTSDYDKINLKGLYGIYADNGKLILDTLVLYTDGIFYYFKSEKDMILFKLKYGL